MFELPMMQGESCQEKQGNNSPSKRKQCQRHREEGDGDREVQHREESLQKSSRQQQALGNETTGKLRPTAANFP